MKKLIILLSSIASFIAPNTAFAETPSPIKIEKPSGLGFSNLSTFITNLLTLAFALAMFVVLVMLIWGSFEWITSGGDKEHVANARNRIINALIGLAVLAVAFALAKVGANFVGIDFANIVIPGPN